MKTSNLLLATLREKPGEAEIISHQLLLRAGMIRKLASGIYTWLPMGLKVLHKVENIIREEMDKIGAQELLMPAIQPAELWQMTGRWNRYGDQLLRIKDRHQHDFCFGPTHEEVITSLVRNEVRSYKQLPQVFYQIQTKFRDELRPRFGVMRGREFIMKDAYSFHLTKQSLDECYEQMYRAYSNIFKRLGLKFRAVEADTGEIGGNCSHEFQVLADSGEDWIAYSDSGEYAANIETAVAEAVGSCQVQVEQDSAADVTGVARQLIATEGYHSVSEVAQFLGISPARILKTLVVRSVNGWIALVLRGDHELNEIKLGKLGIVSEPVEFAPAELLPELVGCHAGSIGPLDLALPMIVDQAAAKEGDFYCGANRDGYHWGHVNWSCEQLSQCQVADIRRVQAGDRALDGGVIKLARGIEVGHIFKLGTKYSSALKAVVLDQQGCAQEMTMGCYGIGVSRTVAAAIEQYHDERGIIWPLAMAPFQVVIIPMNMHKSYRVRELAERLYDELQQCGVEVLLEDRRERAGVLFADMDLIGIPHRVILSESGIDAGSVEYKARAAAGSGDSVSIEQLVPFIMEKLELL